MNNKLDLLATKEFKHYDEMYKVIDFLNKNIKESNIVFGLSIKNGKDVICIYQS